MARVDRRKHSRMERRRQKEAVRRIQLLMFVVLAVFLALAIHAIYVVVT